jgi:molybdopterin/thiamine biosynthesis adenylyltransferase
MLARLGVQEFVLVDPDVVETSNLNRLVGAREADARRSRPKVRVAGRLVQGINSQARVHELVAGVQQKQSLEALRGGDLLFGCTDNDGSRLILNQLAVQYLLPYLDLGAGLQARGQGQLAAAGGQVRLVQPGAFCLACIDGIDRAQAAVDLLPPLARERRERRGYLQESQMPTPAVLFLNNLVAAHAVSEFVCLWTGYREPAALLHIDLLKPQLLAATAERSPDCVTCGQNGVLGLGDLEAVAGAGGDQPSNSVPAVGRPTQTGTEAPATGKKEPRGQTRTR